MFLQWPKTCVEFPLKVMWIFKRWTNSKGGINLIKSFLV